MARQGLSRRAAFGAALFVLPLVSRLPGAPEFVARAQAKMRVEELTIEPAGGGDARAFMVELAETDQEKAVGLMFRTQLADSAGMLFWYGSAHDITMWMRNTYIPLDMVFIGEGGTIARIEAETEPLSEQIIAAGSPVIAVLEIPGGAAARLGIKPGDKVRHRLFE